MKLKEIAKALNSKKAGTIFSMVIEREAKTRKGTDSVIIKTSAIQGMVGTDYANRKPVKESVSSGEREAPELPSHIAETFHEGTTKFWRGHNGKEYLPVCVTGNKPKVTWTQNGEEVDFESIKDFLLASEYPKKPSKDELAEKGQVPMIAVSIENVLRVV